MKNFIKLLFKYNIVLVFVLTFIYLYMLQIPKEYIFKVYSISVLNIIFMILLIFSFSAFFNRIKMTKKMVFRYLQRILLIVIIVIWCCYFIYTMHNIDEYWKNSYIYRQFDKY
ncbi:MAG: Unknown protein [uncultured Campylobacterales bacterium]|uniref:Uncharacterized protein n=1 Tax=uncultured Campylobacterales bacterium TaxID=352960 RepID=A0A6S6SI64_9BACT|nr:MAG: Unknown protein [uncultured Campylobacterales bacterium]